MNYLVTGYVEGYESDVKVVEVDDNLSPEEAEKQARFKMGSFLEQFSDGKDVFVTDAIPLEKAIKERIR